MGEYEKLNYFGVEWNVLVVKTKVVGLAAIKRGEKAVKFDYKSCKLKPDHAKEIAVELRKSSTLLLLDLYGNDNDGGIGPEGAKSIADALKVNKTLQTLNLGCTAIGPEGAKSVADALKVNKTLQTLNLGYTTIGPEGAKSIADVLKVNKTLQTLDLGGNSIGDEAAKSFAGALKVNKTLQILSLSWNKIDPEGAKSIADALKVNNTLQSLDLSFNNIGDEGAKSFADAVKVNKTLQSLDLGANNTTDSALRSQVNASLEQNRQRPQKLWTAEEREELEKHFAAALENGDLQEWGRAKLMVIGEGAAGKTSTVRSLLGLAPVSDHISTVGVDLKVTRAEDWTERPTKESDYDRMANKAAANRNVNGGKPKIEVKSEKRRSGLRESIRKSLKRFSRASNSKRESLSPEDIVPSSSAIRKLNDEKEVARRFDFEGARALAAKTDSGMDVSFSIWDYGGQEVFYALHHIFLSKQGVYLLVFDMSKILALDEVAIEFVEFWLNSVKLHSPGAPIIMVGTRGDQVKSFSDLGKVNRVLCDDLKVLQYSVVENGDYFFFPIDNSNESFSRASTLRKAVECAASELKCVKKLVPLAWMRVLDELFVSGEKYMARTDVVKLAFEYGISNKQADEMLSTFHDLGVLVHQRATERLIETVVLEPQWLLDKLSSVINDHQHSKRVIFDSKVKLAGKIRKDLVSYRQNGIATRSLLEYLWENEKVDFLIDFMKDTMLICDLNGKKDERKYLVTSLMIQEVLVDRKLDLEEFEGGLKCVLDFSEFFLPKGVFQRLVSTCTSVSTREPKMSRKEAVVFLDEEAVALVEERNRITVCLLNDAEDGPGIIKKLISMVREQKEIMMPNLKWKLLLQSPNKRKAVLVDYDELLDAREHNKKKVLPVEALKAVPVSDFDPFFEDESIGPLDTDKEGSVVPKCRLKKLSDRVKYHVFISHKQETAADMAGTLANKLEARGLKVWYDQSLDGNLSEVEMKQGIKESKCYLLLLTKNVFESDAVKMELRTATELGKPIQMVHESQTNLAGFAPFGEYIEGCPPEVKSLFNERESMPFQRRKYLADPFLDELVKRIDQS